MELTRQLLLERRASLEADMFAIQGALQQVDWSLQKLDEDPDAPGTDIVMGTEEVLDVSEALAE